MKYTILELMKILDDNSKGIFIREPHKRGRFYLDNEIIEKGYLKILNKVLLIYLVLAKHANAKNQGCFLTYETIMEESGITNRNTISKALKILSALNIIIIKHFKGTFCNFYYLIDNSKWKPVDSINIDTIISVSKYAKNQYQNKQNSSITIDTLSQRNKSTNKIGINNKLNDEKVLNQTEERTPEEQAKINEALEKLRKWGEEKNLWAKK